MAHLKDRAIMNQLDQQSAALEKLVEICREGYKCNNKNVGFLVNQLRDKEPLPKKSHPKHTLCYGWQDKYSKENYEKRICRCMFYYGKNKDHCSKCIFKRKWLHASDDGIDILDYETPMPYKIEKIGNIDLLIKYKNEVYGVEVKPPEDNKEPISRMISEAITYTIDFPYKPAIAVFEGSYQDELIKKLINENRNFEILKDYVKVFLIKLIDRKDDVVTYRIDPYFVE